MQVLKAILLIVCVSGFAHGDSRTLIANYESDYLCSFLDTEGFHTDEGYAFSVSPSGSVDLRFVEEPYVKYALDCTLDTAKTNQSQLVLRCIYPQNHLAMTLTMDKVTMKAQAEMQTRPIDVFQMKCESNR